MVDDDDLVSGIPECGVTICLKWAGRQQRRREEGILLLLGHGCCGFCGLVVVSGEQL